MKPNLLLFVALTLIATLLFLNLPEQGQSVSAQSDGQRQQENPSDKEVAAELKQMRGEYALLLKEMALLRSKLESDPPAVSDNHHTGMPTSGSASNGGTPGVTIYLDTSKFPPASSQGQEWTAVGFHEAGEAADGSRQAVLSITKITRPDRGKDPEPVSVRAVPVSHWQ